MAQLAIRGHATRGSEVIELLEMLGGVNKHQIDAIRQTYIYFVDEDGVIRLLQIGQLLPEQYIVYSLEEFEEKFPYKVGDKVSSKYLKNYKIEKMNWVDIDNTVIYKLQGMGWYCVNDLQPYKESKCLQELKKYLDNATPEQLKEDWKELEKFSEVGPVADEYIKQLEEFVKPYKEENMEEIEIALAPFKVGDKVIVKGYEKMGEDEVICVFKTYDGDIKYKTKNHLDTHYFMEDSLTRVEKSNKEENMEKRLEPVYELGTGKILYYEEKGSGEKYCPIGETTLYIQEGYEFRDETNNVINAKKITLARKQPQYPKTYAECCKVLGVNSDNFLSIRNLYCDDGEEDTTNYEQDLLDIFDSLWELKICRDAYWKIAGTEMGLDKPWKYDILKDEFSYAISYQYGLIQKHRIRHRNAILTFPTAEMRDAFYENFKELIEQCKELL